MHADLTDASVHIPDDAVTEAPTHEEIAARAFELFEERGSADGSAVDDWIEAERQLLVERAGSIARLAERPFQG